MPLAAEREPAIIVAPEGMVMAEREVIEGRVESSGSIGGRREWVTFQGEDEEEEEEDQTFITPS